VSTLLEHREFLEEVEARAGLDDAEQAREAAESVLAGVARRLDPESRAQLAAVLPSLMADLVNGTGRSAEPEDLPGFLAVVASACDTSPERARYLAQAVLSAIADREPEAAASVRERLPDDFAELFAAPGAGPPPERAATAAMPGPTDLTRAEVERALARLPGWTGDDRRIRRTVRLSPEVDAEVREGIARVEREMNHHARIEEGDDGTTFILWTHARDLVTDLDIELATRIHEIIEGR
jgi:uncharacterized protein (DUF2267 family)/pterin-4a-carbinolamine dehydratase